MRVRVCARIRAHLLITGYAKGEPFNADAGIARERAICKRQSRKALVCTHASTQACLGTSESQRNATALKPHRKHFAIHDMRLNIPRHVLLLEVK